MTRRIGLEDLDHLLDVPAASRTLGLSDATIYRMVARGELDHIRIGAGRGKLRFTRAALVDYVNRQSVTSRVNAPKKRAG